MPVLYKVLPVEGKGLGVVASQFIKRGSLILKEQRQMPTLSSLNSSIIQETIDQFSCIQARTYFYKMRKSDQEGYMELFDKYESEFAKNDAKHSSELVIIKSLVRDIEKDPKEARKIVKIICILMTNSFKSGVSIKMSRLNHSCHPNAVVIGDDVRAISDIQFGQEITITYR